MTMPAVTRATARGRVRASFTARMHSTNAARGCAVRVYVRLMRRLSAGALLVLALAPAASGSDGKSTLEQTITGGDQARGVPVPHGSGRGRPTRCVAISLRRTRAGRTGAFARVLRPAHRLPARRRGVARARRVPRPDPRARARGGVAAAGGARSRLRSSTRRSAQINPFAAASPVAAGRRHARADGLAVTTGDLADNKQRNETEWVVKLLEGGTLDPNSGTGDLSDSCPPGTPLDEAGAVHRRAGLRRLLGPTGLLRPATCRAASTRAGRVPGPDGPRPAAVRGRGPECPVATSAFGNHDGLVQGNADDGRLRGHRDRLRQAVQRRRRPTSQSVLTRPLRRLAEVAPCRPTRTASS